MAKISKSQWSERKGYETPQVLDIPLDHYLTTE